MLAIESKTAGSPEVLQLIETDPPQWQTGEVLIKVHAFGINRPELLQRAGNYPPPSGSSPRLGLELSGTIVEGDSVALKAAGFEIGSQVCALTNGGSYAQLCKVPIRQVLPIPPNWTFTEAGGLCETLFTVWHNLFELGKLKHGERVLIQGGTSGIGVLAIQMALACGAEVYATAGSAEKCQACVRLGATAAINYRNENFAEALKRKGIDIDVVLDMVAGEYVAHELDVLGMYGRLIIISLQGGGQSKASWNILMSKCLTISGSRLRPKTADEKAHIAQAIKTHVWPWFAKGQIQPVVYKVLSAQAIVEAHQILEANQHIGKVIMIWESPNG